MMQAPTIGGMHEIGMRYVLMSALRPASQPKSSRLVYTTPSIATTSSESHNVALTTVAAPPGISRRIVCSGVYPNELTIRAPKAVTPPLQI